jgi:two-component system heavy metal sensor histidine kinase CusS
MTNSHGKRPASLATRVTIFVGIAIVVSLLSLTWVMQQSIAHHFTERDADELRVVARAVTEALVESSKINRHGEFDTIIKGAVSGHHGVYFQIHNEEGEALYSTPGPELSVLMKRAKDVKQIKASNLYQWAEEGLTFRGATLLITTTTAPGQTNEFQIGVATEIDSHLHFIDSFNHRLWIIMLGVGVLTIFAAWFAVHQGHAPLRRVSSSIQTITADRLDIRLPASEVPADLIELVNAFNDMIDRIDIMVQKLASFSSDIAHELRTPLTNMITQTQVVLGNIRQPEEYREILYSNLEEQERLAKTISDMLWLAKTENHLIQPSFVALDMPQEIEKLFDYLEAWSEESRVSLHLIGTCSPIKGDQSMLRRALSNLLMNAIRHSHPDGEVIVRLNETDGWLSIQVENEGDNILAAHLPHLFDRFYRVDPARQRVTEGAGLGLAIVKTIVDVHNGKVSAQSNGGLTSFEIKLPVQ